MVTLFLSLWVVQQATANGLSAGQATAAAGLVIGISQGVATLFAPVLGVWGDRLNRVTVMVIAFGIAAVGYGWTAMISDWTSLDMVSIPALVVLGMGLSGAILASTLLLGQEAQAELRGSIFGLQAFCGAMGILVIAIGGGWMFDNIGPWAPFAAMGALNGLICLFACIVRVVSPGPAGQPGAPAAIH